MKKILLINPSIPKIIKNRDIWLPIRLMYIGGVLKKNNINVEIIDLNIIKDETIIEKIQKIKPDIVGITCIFSGQFSQVHLISKIVKKISKNIIVAIGGIHPTIYSKEILENCDSIDWVIIGEGEYSFLEAINKYYNNEDLFSIDGFAYRNNNKKIIVNKKTKFIENLDELPFPDYSLINLNDYKIYTSNCHNPKNIYIDYIILILLQYYRVEIVL